MYYMISALKDFLRLHRIFWITTAILMLILMVGSSIVWPYSEGMIAFYFWPFALTALILYRQKFWHAITATALIYVYTFVLTFAEEIIFGDSGYGPLTLLFSAIPLIVFALAVPFIAREVTQDKTSRKVISLGILSAFTTYIVLQLLLAFQLYRRLGFDKFSLKDDFFGTIITSGMYVWLFFGALGGYLLRKGWKKIATS